jgi:glutamate-1-semialdehyde 2,1-aminomutase
MSFAPTAADREFFERELASFVPDRVYDAHCHLWPSRRAADVGFPEQAGYQLYRDWIDVLHPGRDVAANFIPIPDDRAKMPAADAWIAAETARDPRCRGEFFVMPEHDPEWVRQEVRRLKLHGLKCYHTMASVTPTWEADIPVYLPEPIIKVAHEEGWHITLHMVKSRSVADEGNIHWIRHYCKTYPNMRLILAHSARGFQPAHNFEGLPKLRGLDNLWFDSSANCEPMAHPSILKILGHERFLYGSDFHISHFRGRSLAAADSFVWLYEDTPVWGEKHTKIQPALIGHEHLRSLKWACWSLGLSDSQVEDIFWNNAARLFGVKG